MILKIKTFRWRLMSLAVKCRSKSLFIWYRLSQALDINEISYSSSTSVLLFEILKQYTNKGLDVSISSVTSKSVNLKIKDIHEHGLRSDPKTRITIILYPTYPKIDYYIGEDILLHIERNIIQDHKNRINAKLEHNNIFSSLDKFIRILYAATCST